MNGLRMLLAVAAAAVAAQISGASAQVDTSPLPGGATAETVFCLQAGELGTGAYASTFLQTGTGAWEERGYLKPGTIRFSERSRDASMVDLFDSGRSLQLKFDFTTKKIRITEPGKDERDIYHILNATDNATSADCAAVAARTAPGANASNDPSSSVVNVFVRPGTIFVIQPGTRLTATSGPPCPGNPGFFLCPNKFTCAKNGGVCCPGAGACAPGAFCDKFINASCIGPGNPRFCAGTGNPVTGTSLHCAPGKVCGAGNLCL